MTPVRDALRRDVVRNRARIIEAGRQVFAEQGVDASMSEIARRAGVGVSTMFRHYACRDELITAVFAEHLAHCAAVTEEAFANPDPWEGLGSFILELGRMQSLDRGLASVVVSWFTGTREEMAIADESCRELDLLIDRAKVSGALRADFSRADIALLLRANSGVLEDPAADWKRFLSRALDGYRAAV